LRETFGGEKFWKKLQHKIKEKVKERKLIAEREVILAKDKEKKDDEYDRKMAYYEERIKVYNEEYRKEQFQMRNKTANVRVLHRRGSDGLIGVNFPFEDFHEEIDVMKEDRIMVLETDGFKWSLADDEEVY
jgi:hypothetical protein